MIAATWKVFFPYLDRHLPLFFVIVILYLAAAYIALPLVLRLWRIVFRPNHIPHYVVTHDGWASDPITFAIIAKNKQHLTTAMENAGWYEADPWNFKNAVKGLRSMVFNATYPEAPLSNLFLFGRPQDIGFEIPTNRALSARTRHHVRFWQLKEPPLTSDGPEHVYTFWFKNLERFIGLNKRVWIAAATEEPFPVDIQWRTGKLTHAGSHDAERERDFIIDSLRKSKQVKSVRQTKPGEKVKFRGQQFRTIYITDGSIKVIELKSTI